MLVAAVLIQAYGQANSRPMSIAGNFITDLQRGRGSGSVSSETEQHLKHGFPRLRRDVSHTILDVAVEAAMKHLERHSVALRRLRESLLGVVQSILQTGTSADEWRPIHRTVPE